MMFRAKVRDGTHFYDPLGLASEGVRVDFQVMANAYLYGGRFMSYIAYTYSPELLVEWIKRTEESKRSYAAEFERVLGLPLDDAWQDWIEFEREHQNQNLEAIRQFPTTDYEDLSDEAYGSMSRAYFDADRNSLIAGVRYPGVVAHIGEYSLDTRELNHLEDVKGPSLYRVSSVAYDQASGTVFYTSDNKALSGPDGHRSRDRESPDAAPRCPYRRTRVQQSGSVNLGCSPSQWIREPRSNSLSL